MDQAKKDMYEALSKACAAAEYLSNWDKSPQKEWYYAAKESLKKMEEKNN